MDAEYYAIAIYETNKMAKKESDINKRKSLYALKERGLEDLFKGGDLHYIGSHFKMISNFKTTGLKIRFLHYYRCGNYRFHSYRFFGESAFHFLGRFHQVA